MYKCYTSLVKFIPKDFILFDSIKNGIVFLIEFSGYILSHWGAESGSSAPTRCSLSPGTSCGPVPASLDREWKWPASGLVCKPPGIPATPSFAISGAGGQAQDACGSHCGRWQSFLLSVLWRGAPPPQQEGASLWDGGGSNKHSMKPLKCEGLFVMEANITSTMTTSLYCWTSSINTCHT